MKTIIQSSFLLLGGIVGMASCSNEEAPDTPAASKDRHILFHTSLPGISTRASEITEELGYFHVTAFDESDSSLITDGIMREYMDTVRLEKDDATTSYTSDLCSWPLPGQESDLLHFFAFYPNIPDTAAIDNQTTADNDGISVDYRISGYSVASDIAEQVDFVAAYASGSMEKNLFSGIRLDFRHMLSRIEVKAWGANKSCDIEIAGVRIGGTGVKDTFSFQPSVDAGEWTGNPTRGEVEYIYRNGDNILTLDRKEGSPLSEGSAISIMGSRIGDYDNCAMLIPANYGGWNYAIDPTNEQSGMYICVLLRVTDATPTGVGTQIYPYTDNTQGANWSAIPTVWLTVDKETGKTVGTRLYLKDNAYFTDSACTLPYSLADNEDVKAFGWASLPISGDWEPGCIYTYTLDYSHGVGLHGPDTPGDDKPKAGDPIISDKVGVSVSVKEWKSGGPASGVEVPGS